MEEYGITLTPPWWKILKFPIRYEYKHTSSDGFDEDNNHFSLNHEIELEPSCIMNSWRTPQYCTKTWDGL